MEPYLTLIAIPSAIAWISPRRTNLLLLWLVMLYYVIFIGCRYMVGPDWDGYENLVEVISWKTTDEILRQAEPGFGLLAWASVKSGFEVYGINVISAIVFCLGMFMLSHATGRPWLGIVSGTSYLVPALAMSGIRQAMAVGIVFFAISRWIRSSIAKRTSLLLFSSLFHFSSIYLMAFVIFGSKLSRFVKMLILLGIAYVTYYIVSDAGQTDVYISRYVGEGKREALGAIFTVLICVGPSIVYILLRKRWQRVYGPDQLLTGMAIASMALVPFIWISSVGASRLALYFFAVPILVWSRLPDLFQGTTATNLLRGAIILGNLAVMVVWLTFANVGFTYFPYRSVMVEWLTSQSSF